MLLDKALLTLDAWLRTMDALKVASVSNINNDHRWKVKRLIDLKHLLVVRLEHFWVSRSLGDDTTQLEHVNNGLRPRGTSLDDSGVASRL